MDTRATENPRKSRIFTQLLDLCGSSLILTLLVGSGTSNSGNSNNGNQHNTSSISGFTISSDNLNVASFAERFTPLGPVKFVFSVFGGIVLLIIGLAFILIDIFILAPFEVGGARFFIENSMEKAGLGYMLSGFQNGTYGKTVWTLFLMKLYTFLWSLLLIIPGIVKSYEYRMVPYLLADCPDLSTEDAFRISREMMDGEKMNASSWIFPLSDGRFSLPSPAVLSVSSMRIRMSTQPMPNCFWF